METVPHRDLRNHSSQILARVRRGESIAVTNHGELAAVISPPAESALDQARRSGHVREARPRALPFTEVRRVLLAQTSAQVLADLRGDR